MRGAIRLLAVGLYDPLAGFELVGDDVGVGGEVEKKFSSLARKFAGRGAITSAGGGASLGGGTSTICGGAGVAQAESASAKSSAVGFELVLGIGEAPLVGGGDIGHGLGVPAFGGAGLGIELLDAIGGGGCGGNVAAHGFTSGVHGAFLPAEGCRGGHGQDNEQDAPGRGNDVGEHSDPHEVGGSGRREAGREQLATGGGGEADVHPGAFLNDLVEAEA